MSTPKEEEQQKDFSFRIRTLIGDGTVSGFARLVNLKQAAIDRYVKGLREPNADALRQISLACNVTTDWLLGVSDNPDGVETSDWRSRAMVAERKLARVSKALSHALKGFEELQEAIE